MTVAKPPSGLPESVAKGASLSSGAYAASLKLGEDACEAETQNTAEYTVARHAQGAGAEVMAALSVDMRWNGTGNGLRAGNVERRCVGWAIDDELCSLQRR